MSTGGVPGNVVVESAAAAGVTDEEIQALLERVYVDGGFTEPERAKAMFAANAVRARGELLVVRGADHRLVGMIIVVRATSPARRIAADDETELHLLAVSHAARGSGIGSALVRAALELGKSWGSAAVVLWTQPNMLAAHRLYAREGFSRQPERDFKVGPKEFLVYQRALG